MYDSIPIRVYIKEVDNALDFIKKTLKIAGNASMSLMHSQITRDEYKKMAEAGIQNMEMVKANLSRISPPCNTTGPAKFKSVHRNLLLAIERYKEAFSEMIKYSDDLRIFHITKATDYIKDYGNGYIKAVDAELRILKKEFLK